MARIGLLYPGIPAGEELTSKGLPSTSAVLGIPLARPLGENPDDDGHERQARRPIYGRLREAWERGLEEVMLGKVVERFRRGVQTQQIKKLHDITEAECKAVEDGMTKSSRWLTGHDQAAAENVPVPEPDELKDDIEALAKWVEGFRGRR